MILLLHTKFFNSVLTAAGRLFYKSSPRNKVQIGSSKPRLTSGCVPECSVAVYNHRIEPTTRTVYYLKTPFPVYPRLRRRLTSVSCGLHIKRLKQAAIDLTKPRALAPTVKIHVPISGLRCWEPWTVTNSE